MSGTADGKDQIRYYVNRDIDRLVYLVLEYLNKPREFGKTLLNVLKDMSPQECSAQPLDIDKLIGTGSTAHVATMTYANQPMYGVTVSRSSIDGSVRYNQNEIVYKVPMLNLSPNDISYNSETNAIALKDPFTELVFSLMSTHLNNIGVSPFLPKVVGAYTCRVPSVDQKSLTLTLVYNRVSSTLGEELVNYKSSRMFNNFTNHFLNITIQVCHGLYAMKSNFGFVHLDLHSYNVLTEYRSRKETKQEIYYNGTSLLDKKYFVIDTCSRDAFTNDRAVVVLPIWNTYFACINDFGYGVAALDRGKNSAIRVSGLSVVTSDETLSNIASGQEATLNALYNETYGNTMDLLFYLFDMYRLSSESELFSREAGAKIQNMLDTVSRTVLDVSIIEFIQQNPELNSENRTRDMSLLKSTRFSTSNYLLEGIKRLCTRVRTKVPIKLGGTLRDTIATVYYVRDDTNDDMVALGTLGVLDKSNCVLVSSCAEDSSMDAILDHSSHSSESERTLHDFTRKSRLSPYREVVDKSSLGWSVTSMTLRRQVKYNCYRDVYSDGSPIDLAKHDTFVEAIKLTVFDFPSTVKGKSLKYELNSIDQSVLNSLLLRVVVGNYSGCPRRRIACYGDVYSGALEYEFIGLSGVKRAPSLKYPAWMHDSCGSVSLPKAGGSQLYVGEINNGTTTIRVRRDESSIICAPWLLNERGLPSLGTTKSWLGDRSDACDCCSPSVVMNTTGVPYNNVMQNHIVVCKKRDTRDAMQIIVVSGASDGLPGLSRYQLSELLLSKGFSSCLSLSSGFASVAQYRSPTNGRLFNTDSIPYHLNGRVLTLSIYGG